MLRRRKGAGAVCQLSLAPASVAGAGGAWTIVPRWPVAADQAARQERHQKREQRRGFRASGHKDRGQCHRRGRDETEGQQRVVSREPLHRLRSRERAPSSREVGELVGPQPTADGRRDSAGDGDGKEEGGAGEERRSRTRAQEAERERADGEEGRRDREVDDDGIDRKRWVRAGGPVASVSRSGRATGSPAGERVCASGESRRWGASTGGRGESGARGGHADRDAHPGRGEGTQGFGAERRKGLGGRLRRSLTRTEAPRVESPRERSAEARLELRDTAGGVDLTTAIGRTGSSRNSQLTIPRRRTVARRLEEERPLRLEPLGEGGPVRRAGEEDGRGERPPREVAGRGPASGVRAPRGRPRSRAARRDRGGRPRPTRRREPGRADGRPLDGLVEAEEPDVGRDAGVARRGEEGGESRPGRRARGESRSQRDAVVAARRTSGGGRRRVDPGCVRTELAGDPAPLVVSGDARRTSDPRVGEVGESCEDALGRHAGDPAPVDRGRRRGRGLSPQPASGPARAPSRSSRRGRPHAASAPRAGASREVETQVGVGQEEDAERHGSEATGTGRKALRLSLLFRRRAWHSPEPPRARTSAASSSTGRLARRPRPGRTMLAGTHGRGAAHAQASHRPGTSSSEPR